MSNLINPFRKTSPAALLRSAFCVVLLAAASSSVAPAHGATWSGIEPFKSRRADVERVLGVVVGEDAEAATLRFNVAGGTATVAFVTRRFVEIKRLAPELEGTVLQIILQHESASATPATLDFEGEKSRFEPETRGTTTVFRNTHDGIFYTFVDDRLRTTRYTLTSEQQAKSRRRK